MNSLKHSFKTHTHKAKEEGEKQPILQVNHLENYNTQYSMATSSTEAAAAAAVDSSNKRKEVVVKINGEGGDNNLSGGGSGGNTIKNPMQREVSYEFWKEDGSKGGGGGDNDNGGGGDKVDDPPSKLIGQFLNKQMASGEICLDMDLEMEELRNDRITPIPEEPKAEEEEEKEPNFSFQGPSPKTVVTESVLRRRSSGIDRQPQPGRDSTSMGRDDGGGGGGGEALKRTPTMRKNKSFMRCKTKSRLIDTDKVDRRSGRVARSGQLKSGYLGRMNDEEEEDPFADGDLPDEYRKATFSTLTIIQWVTLILIIGALVSSLVIHRFKKKLLWDLPIWKWLLFCFVLLCGRLVSGWIIRFCVFFIERSFILRKRVLYFVYGVRKAVQNCLWLGLVLIAWHYLFDKKVTVEVKGKTLPYVVTKVLICFLVGTLLWLVKTLLVKVLASSFHVSTYFDRIQDSLFNQYVIETLSGPPLLEMQNIQEEQEKTMVEIEKLQNAGATMPYDLKATALSPMKNGTVIGSGVLQNSPRVVKSFRVSGALAKKQEEGITIEQLHKLNQKNISAWNMKRLMAIVRHGVLSTLDDHIQEAANEDDSANEIRSECEAKYAARKIFNNVSKPHSKFIYLDDLLRFMGDDEASRTMNLFEGVSESKRVSKKALKSWVVIFLSCIQWFIILDYVRSCSRCQMNSNKEIFRDKDPYHINAFRERRALALTLDDTKTAVNQLHRMVNAVIAILLLVICLLILGIATTQLLVFISSQLLLVAFMFGNTCKMVFESIIFLFVMHPFDVGDRCEIDGIQMVVEEMNILTTVFLKFDNHKIVYPNIILSTKPISNYYRSPDMGDAIDFCVHIATSAEKIALMKQRIIGYIENKTEHWYPGPMVVLRDVEDMNRLKISIWLQHRMNHQDMGERWARRALLVEEMIKILRDLDIEYRMLPLDINVRNMPPISSTRVPSLWSACNN